MFCDEVRKKWRYFIMFDPERRIKWRFNAPLYATLRPLAPKLALALSAMRYCKMGVGAGKGLCQGRWWGYGG